MFPVVLILNSLICPLNLNYNNQLRFIISHEVWVNCTLLRQCPLPTGLQQLLQSFGHIQGPAVPPALRLQTFGHYQSTQRNPKMRSKAADRHSQPARGTWQEGWPGWDRSLGLAQASQFDGWREDYLQNVNFRSCGLALQWPSTEQEPRGVGIFSSCNSRIRVNSIMWAQAKQSLV